MTIPRFPKQEYPAEFKELAVKCVKDGQPVGSVARDLGLIEQTLRNWVKAFDAGKLNGQGARRTRRRRWSSRACGPRTSGSSGRMRF